MKMLSPLRYPGGKGQLLGQVSALIKENGFEGGEYIEPYAGGASIPINLLLSGRIEKAFINDIDKAVYAFWHSAINHTEELLSRPSLPSRLAFEGKAFF